MQRRPNLPNDVLAANARIRALARSLATHDVAADDVIQEVWLGVARNGNMGAPRSPTAFWSKLVRNAASNLRQARQRSRAREQHAVRDSVDEAPGPFDMAAFEERRQELARVVESLPQAQRDVVVACYWQGLALTEIARRNREEPAAVRQRMRRALANLRQRLDRRTDATRGAWLLPLIADCANTPMLTTSLATGLPAGAFMMKKVLVGTALLLLLGGGLWIGPQWLAGPVAPDAPGVLPSAASPAPTIAASNAPDREAVSQPLATARVRPFRLLDADGGALAGVPYWRDERPYRMHPATAPANAQRTDDQGHFDTPDLGESQWLWFEIHEGLCIATPNTALAISHKVRMPRTQRISVEIRSLPTNEPWALSVYPAWSRPGKSHTHASNHVQRFERADLPELWVARKWQSIAGESGQARASFALVEGLPHAFYGFAPGYEVEPDVQIATDVALVLMHVGAHKSVFPFAVFESDGTTRSDIGGRWLFSTAADSWSYGTLFHAGQGRIGRSHTEQRDGVWLSFVLQDGEVFRFTLDDVRVRDDQVLRLVRGTGRPAIRRITLPGPIAAWLQDEINYVRNGQLHDAEQFAWFDPVPGSSSLAAWRYQDHIVVQTSDPKTAAPDLWLVASDGHIAKEVHGTFTAFEHQSMQPIRPQWLLDRYAVGASKMSVRQELQLPELAGLRHGGWIEVKMLHFHKVAHFGWRLSRSSTTSRHEALPASLPTYAPVGARSRLLIRSHRREVRVPHLPLR